VIDNEDDRTRRLSMEIVYGGDEGTEDPPVKKS